jgi:hypothetical protein
MGRLFRLLINLEIFHFYFWAALGLRKRAAGAIHAPSIQSSTRQPFPLAIAQARIYEAMLVVAVVAMVASSKCRFFQLMASHPHSADGRGLSHITITLIYMTCTVVYSREKA